MKRPIAIANELFRGKLISLKHILCFSADIKQSFTSTRIEPPHLIVLAYKIYPYKINYFFHYQKRFSCDPPLRFISISVQLAHSTKKLWEKENSIEYRISFLPKRIFGVNRKPKILINVANFFWKDQLLLPMSCFEEPNFFGAHFVFFSWYQVKQNFTSSRIEPPHLIVLAYKIFSYKIIYILSLSKTL